MARRSTTTVDIDLDPAVVDRFIEDAIEITGRVPGGDTLSVRWDLSCVDNGPSSQSLWIGGDTFRDIATGTHGALFEFGPYRGYTAEDTLRALAALCTQLADRVAKRLT